MRLIFIILIIILLLWFLNSNCKEDFVPVEALTSYTDMKANINLFKKILKILNKHNIQYWITGGTLIGAVRSNGMIPWDDDIDISIMEEYEEKLLSLKEELAENNLDIVKAFYGYKIFEFTGSDIYELYDDNANKIDKNMAKKYDFKYPFLDIFTYVQHDDMVVLKEERAKYTWPTEVFEYNKLFPLKEWQFEDMIVYGPNDPYIYLDTSYPNWKTKGIKPAFEHKTHDYNKEYKFDLVTNNSKPNIYIWDDYNERTIESVKINCMKDFNIVLLNNNIINMLLPELKEDKYMKIKLNKDNYIIMLLYKYGGIYLKPNVIVLDNLLIIIEKLKKYDFVISNLLLASRPNTKLLGLVLNKILNNKSLLVEKVRNDKDFYGLESVLLKDKEESIPLEETMRINSQSLVKEESIPLEETINELVKNDNYEYYRYNDSLIRKL